MSLDLSQLVDKKVICRFLTGVEFRWVFVGVSDNFKIYALKDGDNTILVPAEMVVIIEVTDRKQVIRPNLVVNNETQK